MSEDDSRCLRERPGSAGEEGPQGWRKGLETGTRRAAGGAGASLDVVQGLPGVQELAKQGHSPEPLSKEPSKARGRSVLLDQRGGQWGWAEWTKGRWVE